MTALSDLKASDFPPAAYEGVYGLISTRRQACETRGRPLPDHDVIEQMLVDGVRSHLKEPWFFAHYHQAVREPQDWYQFGLKFTGAVIDEEQSTLGDRKVIDQIQSQLDAKENIILLGNHQSEMDPQILSFLLQPDYPHIAEEVIFVAGHRVTTDPAAVPFSAGRNLLCIHSKRHIDNPPEEREAKQRHNQRTMTTMRELLCEGGACIYVAPSGGRDRFDADGALQVAPFDPQAIEMFYLMARKAKRPTHFYPLTLASYAVLPPPREVSTTLGEPRNMSFTPVHAHFSAELDMETFPGDDLENKKERRQARANYIHSIVKDTHSRLTQ